MQAEGAGALADLAAKAGVAQLVQVSAIGAAARKPLRLRQDQGTGGGGGAGGVWPGDDPAAQHRVRAGRPSFFNRFARLAEIAPIMPVIAGATRFQPVYVGDVADAVMQVLARPEAAGTLYELGGPRVMNFQEILGWILAQTGRHQRLVAIAAGCRAVAGQHSVQRADAGPAADAGARQYCRPGGAGADRDWGILPTPIELVVPAYLQRYRQGGRDVGDVLAVSKRT